MDDSPEKKTIRFSAKFDSLHFFPLLLCMTQCRCTSIWSYQSSNIL